MDGSVCQCKRMGKVKTGIEVKFFCALLFLGVYQIAEGQDSLAAQNGPAQKDVRDLFSKKNKKKPNPDAVQVALDFTYLPAAGYSLQTGFAAVISANLAFRSGKSKDAKLSSINTSFTYSQYNQTILPLMANIWSRNGKWNYSVDWRYMKYPSTTLGPGRA